jgi:hypothetical protein
VDIRETEKLERTIRMIEIALVIGKNLTLIMAVFVGISFALAAYNAAVGNIVWSVVSLAFGAAGLVFFAQIRQTRRRHYRRRVTYQETKQLKYREAEAA